jgi:hypothetical protein
MRERRDTEEGERTEAQLAALAGSGHGEGGLAQLSTLLHPNLTTTGGSYITNPSPGYGRLQPQPPDILVAARQGVSPRRVHQQRLRPFFCSSQTIRRS